MIWVKVLHIFFVISWMAAIFYLPRLFVYHANTHDEAGNARFKLMEKKLLGMMNFAAVPAIGFGLWLWLGFGFAGNWLNTKLLLVLLLLAYQAWCIITIKAFREDRNTHSHVYFRWMNELPVFLLLGILVMVVVKPF